MCKLMSIYILLIIRFEVIAVEPWRDFMGLLLELVLQDKEVRVRLIAGDVVALCTYHTYIHCGGINLFEDVVAKDLIDDIEENMFLDRDPTADEDDEGRRLKKKLLDGLAANEEREMQAKAIIQDTKATRKKESSRDSYMSRYVLLQRSLFNALIYVLVPSSVSSVYHDTAGWKTLDSNMKCIQRVYALVDESFRPPVPYELLELILNCCLHINRYTRESAFYVLASICPSFTTHVSTDNEELFDNIVSRLVIGLVDDWTEVCYAASTATRVFVLSIARDVAERYFPQLLPRICFNRYHYAEGLKRYSLESWQLILKQEGRNTLSTYISCFAEFYLSRLRSDHSEMRSCACLCINEVISKLDVAIVEPYIPKLFTNVLFALDDSSWSVRSYAAVTINSFIQFHYAAISEKEKLLVDILFEINSDETWSVRENSSICIAGVYAGTINGEIKQVIKNRISEGLVAALAMIDETLKYHNQDIQAAKLLRDNDVSLHSKGTTLTGCCAITDEATRHKMNFYGKVDVYAALLESNKDDLCPESNEIDVSLSSKEGMLTGLPPVIDDGHCHLPGHDCDDEDMSYR